MNLFPRYILQRHPVPVEAHFRFSLVLTYALPQQTLTPMLPPGLSLDQHNGLGFVAIAIVQTQSLRPAAFPRCLGQSFWLAGYRIFSTFKPRRGNTLRGLYILRSDTDRAFMAFAGNLLTHYQYRVSEFDARLTPDAVTCSIETAGHAADLRVTADLAAAPALPGGSPFATVAQARRFAGPLPWTFDHERETNSIIAIKGERKNWEPRLVTADVSRATFLEQGLFAGTRPTLASAFFVHDIPYRWNVGIRHSLDQPGEQS